MTTLVWIYLRGGCLAFALLLSGLPTLAQTTTVPSAQATAKLHDSQKSFLKGNAEFKAKRFPQALEAYLDALAEVEDSQHPEVLFNIAVTYRALHRPKEAAYYEQRYQTLTQSPATAPAKPPPPTITAPEVPAPPAGNPSPKPPEGPTPTVAPITVKTSVTTPSKVQTYKANKVVPEQHWWSPSPLGSWSTVFKYGLYIGAVLLLVFSFFAFSDGAIGWGLLIIVAAIAAAYWGRTL